MELFRPGIIELLVLNQDTSEDSPIKIYSFSNIGEVSITPMLNSVSAETPDVFNKIYISARYRISIELVEFTNEIISFIEEIMDYATTGKYFYLRRKNQAERYPGYFVYVGFNKIDKLLSGNDLRKFTLLFETYNITSSMDFVYDGYGFWYGGVKVNGSDAPQGYGDCF